MVCLEKTGKTPSFAKNFEKKLKLVTPIENFPCLFSYNVAQILPTREHTNSKHLLQFPNRMRAKYRRNNYRQNCLSVEKTHTTNRNQ